MVSQKTSKEGNKFTTIRILVEDYQKLIKLAVEGETMDKIINKILNANKQ